MSSPDSSPTSMICPRCRTVYGPNKVFCPQDGARLTDRLEPDASEESPDAPCSTLIAGRYELGQLIGHGSMARVFAARDLSTQSNVAVKVLNRRYAEKESERRRFFREARAVLSIDHPNVVKVLDVGRRIDGRPFLVIEYLQGESLGEYLRRGKHLSLETALPIFRDAAWGLQAVHAAGIVHRDVKPDNIFLVGEANAPREVRLVDFGLAKLHGNKRRASKPGITLGTAAYMPPEQVLSEKVDARADVYSLGVVMFRALTGHLPFEGENDLDMLSHQVLLQAPPPSWFFDHLNTSVDTIVQHAMCKHPDNRYQDMACFARDIEKLIAKEEISPKNKVQRDAYRPSTSLGMETALLFCQKLGITPPWNE